MARPIPPRARHLAVLAAASILVLGGCGGGSSSDGAKATTTAEASTTLASDGALQILVSNDDGYGADGIDALVAGLRTLEKVDVVVVAPESNQSGTGGNETKGKLKVTDVETKGGYAAKAVQGFPADSIRVAMDDLGIEPDLVVTGINQGQNLGPLVDASGTVGAARAAVDRGVPALATSQGLGQQFDYDAAVPLILDWIRDHRDDLVAHEQVAKVTNLNIPSCDAGELRGLVEVEADLGGDAAAALKEQDCTSTAPGDSFTQDVPAFNAGFATISEVPAKPAS